MKPHVSLIVLTLFACKVAMACGEEKLLLPKSHPPMPAIASLDKKGKVVLRMQVGQYVPKKTGDGRSRGKDQFTYEMIWHEQTYRLSTKEVRIHDSSGKEIDVRTLPTLLKEETPALYCYGDKLDPLHLRTVRAGTLIFVYQDPERTSANEVGKPSAPSANAPGGLEDFLKKQNYVAVPLRRLETGHLVVPVQVAGKKLLLGLDTGAHHTALDRFRVRHLDLDWDDDFQCELEDMEIAGIKTGPFWVEAHDLTDANRSLKYYNDPAMDGLLGADVLRPLSAVIDHAGAIVYLRKSEPNQQKPKAP
jgi:hypothetical protein